MKKHTLAQLVVAAVVTGAGCQLIGGIDDRSLGPDGSAEAQAPPDAPGGSDSGNASDSSAPVDSGAMIDGGLDSPADAGCGTDAALSYVQEVLCDAPLAYWRLDETTTGTMANDSSGNNHNATYSGSVSLKASGIPGAGGDYAVTLDGVTGYINAGDIFAFVDKVPFTLEAWILPTAFDTTYRGVMSNEFQTGTDKEGYVIYLQSEAGIGYDRYEGGTSTPLVAPDAGVGVSSTWYHVVGVYDGTQMSLYVNANLVASSKTSLAIQPTSCVFAMGASHCGAEGHFQGSLDEMAVYSGPLSLARIQRHYEAGAGP